MTKNTVEDGTGTPSGSVVRSNSQYVRVGNDLDNALMYERYTSCR